ncbi:MFS transporter [Actinomycetospora sp. TBRC 11914]|uniref:MFS transporter n=1 Tax=Actinomycetospora sp. TBRC 11914 TaxID=2729387 RepID=UPI00145F51F7|nr:MFS transporter [Actinomycetospora sp. TBRC 11914]NMO88282.1 MFS transporter [Actinomycetospora sp. TBRC 11914]
MSRRWVVATGVLIITAVAYVDRVNLSVAEPVLAREFHASTAVLGVILSSFTWTYTACAIPAGLLVDRVRTRVVFPAILGLWAVASFLTAGVRTVGGLIAPRLLLGVSESPFAPASIRTLNTWLPQRERGLGSSMFISGVALGSAVGPPGLAWLVAHHGWQSCFVATGILSAVIAVVWAVAYREPRPAEDHSPAPEERPTALPWRALLGSRNLWFLIGGYFCLLYILYTFVSWVPGYLVADRGFTLLGSGVSTSIPWAVAFVAGLFGGRLSDAALRRGRAPLAARKVVLVGGMVVALAIVGAALIDSAAAAIVFLAISTSGIIVANGAVWAATQDVVHDLGMTGSASGFVNFWGNVGGILGPIVTGVLATTTGTFVAPLVVAGALALVGAASFGALRPRDQAVAS